MEIKNLSLDQLKPYEKNARIHSKKQIERIAASIKEFGFLVPVLITQDYRVIAGHGRLSAAKHLRLKTIPTLTRINHLTQEQINAYTLADNRLAELSEWDEQLLHEELKSTA
jgi:ParB/RepB/Spo0J family partition protein